MRVLIFQAATSAVAIAAMTRLGDDIRGKGHAVGLRQLQAFRREKEPADRIVVALTPNQARDMKNLGAELVQVFNDADKFIPLELPETDEELKDFEFNLSGFDDNDTGELSMEQLRAEAIERAIEVRADSSREELEHALDLGGDVGAQAGDRATDRRLGGDGGYTADRPGLRTSTILPNANGLDLERMNDDQVRATAAQLNIKVPRNVSRATLINKITAVYAEKVGAPEDSAPESPAEALDMSDVDGLDDADAIKAIADGEGIDLGRTTSVDGMKAKIREAREAKADEGGTNG